MEWQEPMLEQSIAEIESRHEDYVRENINTETSINMYRDAIWRRRGQEAGLRQQAEDKKREAERKFFILVQMQGNIFSHL